MRIPMTDLTAQYVALQEEINPVIQRVIGSGRFILGPDVENFEKEFAEYCGAKYAIGVASGTDSLILSVIACGIKSGDEVITTPFTFIATAEAISHCGAVPVFVDIDPRTYNIDVSRIPSRISSKTRAILPVHLFGQPAEMEPILALGRKHNLKIIEDCAQALSAEYKGVRVGAIGEAGCFSFFPSKNLGAFGDGGAVITNDSGIAERVRELRNHGARITYYHNCPGYNSRLDAMQAAILRVKLKHLDGWSDLRRRNSLMYNKLLAEIDGIETPFIGEHVLTSANYYTIRLRNRGINRDELRKYLSAREVETAIYYPLSLHLQEAYRSLGYKPGDFPESESAQNQVLSLPMFPELKTDQIEAVVGALKQFIAEPARVLGR
jgi:dTDP-4-amino-4,6-dideoxygalactose transaminase